MCRRTILRAWGERRCYGNSTRSLSVFCSSDTGAVRSRVCSGQRGGFVWSASAAGVCSAALSSRGLHLDPGLLGVGPRFWRLLLGAGNMGPGPRSRLLLDARLVGMGRRRIHVPWRLLGPGGGVLWGDQL